MDSLWGFLVWSIGILAPAMVLLCQWMKSKSNRLLPGPPGWPVFGNMFQLVSMPHKTIARLRKEYGPVVWLRIASINTMAVLTAKAATELFKNHDITFVERTIIEVMKSNGFNKAALSLAPYGSYWRVMKRIMTVEMLVNRRINETVSIRQRCINNMILWIEKEANSTKQPGGIHLARFVFLASFNMLGNLMLSHDLVDPQSEEGSKFFTAMMGLMEWSGHPNIVDLFPWLKWLDPQGLRRKMDHDLGTTLKLVAGFVAERLKAREDGEERKNFLEVLLQFEGNGKDEPAKISDHDLNIIIMEIFLAGSETTSSTTEWVMAELLSHPETMTKVKKELAEVIPKNNKFEEKHIENLPYLQAAVKETLRLHPPIPFLVPRKATQDTNFMGYHIPKNTQLFVNAWAIGRDSDCWEKPLSFKPERFLDSKIDYRGQHFELIPFGAGRRICAGIPLAHRMLHLALGSLLHDFDWEIDEIARNDIMYPRERMGVTVRKLLPVKAIPTISRMSSQTK